MTGKMKRNTRFWLVTVLVALLTGGCAGVAPIPLTTGAGGRGIRIG